MSLTQRAVRVGTDGRSAKATKSIAMNAIHQIIILLRNTLLVTLAIAGGFILGGTIGIPSWLQMFCLIPAGYLLVRFSGVPIPPMRRWVPSAIAITGVVTVMSLADEFVRSHFPSLYGSFWLSLIIFSAAFLTMRAFAAFIERHWPFGGADTSAETKTP